MRSSSHSAPALQQQNNEAFLSIFFDFSEVNLLVFEEQMDLGLENPRSDSRSSVHYTYKLSSPGSFASVSSRGVKPNFKNEQKWTKKKIKNQIFVDLFSLSQTTRVGDLMWHEDSMTPVEHYPQV